jgi:hypothetical protein
MNSNSVNWVIDDKEVIFSFDLNKIFLSILITIEFVLFVNLFIDFHLVINKQLLQQNHNSIKSSINEMLEIFVH